MTQWPHDNDAELDAFYGRPDGSAKWEIQNLTYIFPPWKAYLAGSDPAVELIHGIRVHKLVAASLETIFASLWEQFGKSQAEIEKVDLHQIGGAYYFRARRGSSRLSNHARGIAIDIDPQDNQMGRGKPWDMDPRIVAAFEAEGWRWGKAFNDPMHFEAVDNGKPRVQWTQINDPTNWDVAQHKRWAIDAMPHVKRFEAFRAAPYLDGKNPDGSVRWSHGYGRKCEENTAPITEAQASLMLANDLADLALKIAPLIKVKLNDNQGAALLSFAYNLGDAALAKSTLLKLLNTGEYQKAADQFNRWTKAGGKTLPGLVKRRADERALFLS